MLQFMKLFFSIESCINQMVLLTSKHVFLRSMSILCVFTDLHVYFIDLCIVRVELSWYLLNHSLYTTVYCRYRVLDDLDQSPITVEYCWTDTHYVLYDYVKPGVAHETWHVGYSHIWKTPCINIEIPREPSFMMHRVTMNLKGNLMARAELWITQSLASSGVISVAQLTRCRHQTE